MLNFCGFLYIYSPFFNRYLILIWLMSKVHKSLCPIYVIYNNTNLFARPIISIFCIWKTTIGYDGYTVYLAWIRTLFVDTNKTPALIIKQIIICHLNKIISSWDFCFSMNLIRNHRCGFQFVSLNITTQTDSLINKNNIRGCCNRPAELITSHHGGHCHNWKCQFHVLSLFDLNKWSFPWRSLQP